MRISVIICTRNRARSLAETLECLARADQANLSAEAIVIDNGSADDTRSVAESISNRLPLRYLYEPATGNYGKSHALNCALNAGGLGDIVAVLDDDMSPHPDWFQGVAAICARHPDKDLFTGRSYIIWPCESVPMWAHHPTLRGWIFSVMDYGPSDRPLQSGMWFSGNHYWFRSHVLKQNMRFNDIWLTAEADFMLRLAEKGHTGVCGPDAVVGHRIQESLLDKANVYQRALRTGEQFATLRLNPAFKRLKHVQLFARHPVLARLFCALQWCRWTLATRFAGCFSSADVRFACRICALERRSAFRTFLKEASLHPEYDWRPTFLRRKPTRRADIPVCR